MLQITYLWNNLQVCIIVTHKVQEMAFHEISIDKKQGLFQLYLNSNRISLNLKVNSVSLKVIETTQKHLLQ